MNEEGRDQKRTWTKPELIILVRSRPEEAVLLACKGGSTSGPADAVALCTNPVVVCAQLCNLNAAS